MSEQATLPTPSLRVVLIGRSPVESRLRRDPHTEVVRARTSLDAIGEVATPGEWRRTVVLISPDGVDEATAPSLVESLRRVDDRCLILALDAPPGSDSNGAAHRHAAAHRAVSRIADGAAPIWIDAARLRELALPPAPTAPSAHQAPGPSNPAPQAPPKQAQGPAPARPNSPANAGAGDAGDDIALLTAAIEGRDLLGPCLDAIRARLGAPEVSLVGGGAAGGAPVERAGVSYGSLVDAGGRASPDALRASARWLAHWLALRDQQAQLRSAAFQDAVTGAWNRRYFDRYLPTAIDHARAHRHEAALLILDIDNFKRFNDEHGHAAGDEILREVARLLRSAVRPSDRVCRIGGDEFAVVFYEPEGPRDPSVRRPQQISSLLARFQREVGASRFPRLGDNDAGALSVSGGLATFPWDAQDVAGLIARADALAIDSKRLGKNMIRFGPSGGDDLRNPLGGP